MTPMSFPALRPHLLALACLLVAACQASPTNGRGEAGPVPSTAPAAAPAEAGALRVDTIATGLEHPWSVAVLPDGGFLVTERPGRLRRVDAGGSVSEPIGGVPAVWARGQGGLLDVVPDPAFASNRRIWLSYAEPGDNGTAGTAVATGVLGADALTDVRVVYRQVPKLDGGQHFGSRIVFDGRGHVFISHGDRGQKSMAQDLDVLQGKLVRLNLDGSQPADNPFADGPGVRRAIWSYGHRNIQGMATDPRTGALWLSEHGPRGGDELNLPQAGRNYGWPVVSHGMDYVSNRPYPETRGTEAPGMEPPHHVWLKSPGLSGMAFLTGRPGHPWNDSLFLGALAERNLIRVQLDGNRIVSEERLLEDLGQRIRDVRVGPQGEVYVLTDDGNGRLLRLVAPAAR